MIPGSCVSRNAFLCEEELMCRNAMEIAAGGGDLDGDEEAGYG